MIKQLSLLIIINFLFFTSIYSQSVTIELPSIHDTIPRYKFTGLGVNQINLRTNHADYRFLNPDNITYLKDKKIKKIELIYTAYPENADLSKLNQKRMVSLFLLKPELFEDSTIQWRIVRQSEGRYPKKMYSMFHGFAITYSTSQSFSITKIDPDIPYSATTIQKIYSGEQELKDSTVLEVFERHDDWENMLVVTDLTGSMSPYAASILVWYKLTLNKKKAKYFVFFNDGDTLINSKKVIGETGGIYHTKSKNIDEVFTTMVKTIKGGGGGDTEENNLEAALFAINTYKDFDELVMIADNSASPRDMELLSQIKVPIKVILCGYGKNINPDYLTIARQTGGSVHTIEEDIVDLMKFNEGEVITINGQEYKIVDGKFTYSF